VSAPQGDLSSDLPMKAEDSSVVLQRALLQPRRRYKPDDDNYEDFIVARAKYRHTLTRTHDKNVASMVSGGCEHAHLIAALRHRVSRRATGAL